MKILAFTTVLLNELSVPIPQRLVTSDPVRIVSLGSIRGGQWFAPVIATVLPAADFFCPNDPFKVSHIAWVKREEICISDRLFVISHVHPAPGKIFLCDVCLYGLPFGFRNRSRRNQWGRSRCWRNLVRKR